MKRGWLFCLFIVLLVSFPLVIAEHTADVSLYSTTPNPVYEFNNVKIKINVENLEDSSHNITQIILNSTLLNIISVGVGGWSSSFSSNQVTWSGGEILADGSQRFTFYATVLNLASDQTETLLVKTEDANGDSQLNRINISLLADLNAPAYILNSPQENAFVKNGSLLFDITVTEEESGLDYSVVHYTYMDNVNKSMSTSFLPLECIDNNCTSLYTTEESNRYLGFYFEVVDKAGNKNFTDWNDAAWHYVYIDSEAPVLTLDYPSNNLPYDTNNINTDGISDFNYTASDENGIVICQLYVGNNLKASGTNNFSEIDFSDLGVQNDPYTWEVRCNDSANNQGNALGLVYFDAINPGISLISASADSSLATISWQVDETADNAVYYGTNSSDLVNSENMGISATPSGEVSGLSASTLYFYLVQSCDQFRHCINFTEIYNFTTTEQITEPSSSSGGGGGGTRIRRTAGNEERIVTQEVYPRTKSEEKIPEEALAPEIVCDYVLEVLLPETISFLKQDAYEGEVINKGNCCIPKLNLYSSSELNSVISFSPAIITDLAPGNKSKFQLIRRTEKRAWPFSLFTGSAIAEKMITKKISGTVTIEGLEEEGLLFTKDLPVNIEVFAPEKIVQTVKIAFPSIIFLALFLLSAFVLIKKRKKREIIPKSL